MAATNYKDRVEGVLWRDGRMQLLKVSLPTKEQLVEVYSKTIQTHMEKFYTSGVSVSQYDVQRLAWFSENKSSAFVDVSSMLQFLLKKLLIRIRLLRAKRAGTRDCCVTRAAKAVFC